MEVPRWISLSPPYARICAGQPTVVMVSSWGHVNLFRHMTNISLIPGFSSGVNPDDFKGSYPSGYDPVWEDLLLKHQEKAFHCMVGGGDQIYCDAVTREPELQSA